MKATISDTTVSIHKKKSELTEEFEQENIDFFRKTMNFLGSIGFFVGDDKKIKKDYPILNPKHRYGRYGDLEFKAEIYGIGFKVEFYQNVNYENRCGGYYDFDKLKKMPYLIRLQFELSIQKLSAFLNSKCIEVERIKEYKGADFVVHKYIDSWHKPQKEIFDLSEIDGETVENCFCNVIDRDKKLMKNGDVKYFRDDRSGYLYRGKVYHNINNMWWVLLPCGTVRNIAAFELFDLQEWDTRSRVAPDRMPNSYKLKKEQLSLCSMKELTRELKRRGWRG